jgi:hypothetical protein
LSRLYQEKEKEVIMRDEKEKEMHEEIERLGEMAAFKNDWQELNRAHEALLKKNQLT